VERVEVLGVTALKKGALLLLCIQAAQSPVQEVTRRHPGQADAVVPLAPRLT